MRPRTNARRELGLHRPVGRIGQPHALAESDHPQAANAAECPRSYSLECVASAGGMHPRWAAGPEIVSARKGRYGQVSYW